ncbi:prepilin-type N-terminal cleavage/methylation domain-containing protein [Patescibacteria group bacterium]|nr:prepilin-type N-terminal cleavage/methylation domain-containing protein [Patescibacteria group bacterium]
MVQIKHALAPRGFSLMELLVVMGIFSVISTVVLVNHSKFNSSVLLGNLAYSIAVSIREAQVYGVSVQQYNSNFKTGYGVHVESADPQSYILFADTNANNVYDSDVDSIVRQYTLNKQHSIVNFCGMKSNGDEECSDGSTGVTISHLDVVFFRPDPDANISSDKTSVSTGMYSTAKITVQSASGESRSLSVASTGQISVSPTTSAPQ